MKTLHELLLEPDTAAAFPPDRLAGIERALQANPDHDTPWYLRVVIGIGAWLASLFFFGSACALLGWDHPGRAGIAGLGVVVLIAAVIVGRQKWGLFVEQAALAASLAAQGMIYAGLLDDGPGSHPLRTAMAIALTLAVLLYAAFPSFLSQLITCFGALQITLVWTQWGDVGEPWANHDLTQIALLGLAWWAVHLGGIVFTLLKPQRHVDLKPLGYAFIASLAAWQIENLCDAWTQIAAPGLSPDPMIWAAHNLRGTLVGLALLIVAAWAAGGRAAVREHLAPFLGLAAGVAALVYLGLGGVLLALLFVLLGFALQDRPVLGLGLVLFPVFLSHYYYSLQLDLLQKSGVLIASGIVVLVLRTVLMRTMGSASQAKEIA